MMGTPGNRSTEPGLQGLQNQKAARQWAAFFRNHSPATILHDKKDTQAAILVRGALGFHRNDPTMRGRALDCCRNRSRACTNPETSERLSETETAAIADRIAITLYFFPSSGLHRPPAVSGAPRTPAPAVLRDRFFIPSLFSGRFYCYFNNK